MYRQRLRQGQMGELRVYHSAGSGPQMIGLLSGGRMVLPEFCRELLLNFHLPSGYV